MRRFGEVWNLGSKNVKQDPTFTARSWCVLRSFEQVTRRVKNHARLDVMDCPPTPEPAAVSASCQLPASRQGKPMQYN